MAEKKAGPKLVKKVAKKKPPIQEKQIYMKNLKCDLTAEAVSEAADALARNLDDLESIEADKKDVMEQFKAKAASCEAEVIRLRNLVRNKYEFTDVKCEQVKDFKKGTCTVKRLDTKKIVDKRSLTAGEKQRMLPGLENPDGIAEGAPMRTPDEKARL